eukprot:TRINITY_DN6654_c0_g1_i1.p3 TRINITY_DN6654_c0_g1~~TRINITY_DN6654_c0_g1_i1.p3  ORF type:complete len:134 (-),score=22.00 TRINITY_DN6654_c0_g1_i1:38-439(-)
MAQPFWWTPLFQQRSSVPQFCLRGPRPVVTRNFSSLSSAMGPITCGAKECFGRAKDTATLTTNIRVTDVAITCNFEIIFGGGFATSVMSAMNASVGAEPTSCPESGNAFSDFDVPAGIKPKVGMLGDEQQQQQ